MLVTIATVLFLWRVSLYSSSGIRALGKPWRLAAQLPLPGARRCMIQTGSGFQPKAKSPEIKQKRECDPEVRTRMLRKLRGYPWLRQVEIPEKSYPESLKP